MEAPLYTGMTTETERATDQRYHSAFRMEETQYHLLAEVEDRHWWHRTLRSAVVQALAATIEDGDRVLDVGCGTGGLLASLEAHYDAVGVDLSALALEYSASRGLTGLVRGTMLELPFPDDRFDAVVSIDSLTHASVESETAALEEHRRVLRPGGTLVVQVSAFEWLRGRHDDEVHQQRRYSRRQLRAALARAGFEELQYRYRLAFMPPLMIANNGLSRLKRDRTADIAVPSAWVNEVLHRAAGIDLRWGGRSPLGSSVFCVAKKR